MSTIPAEEAGLSPGITSAFRDDYRQFDGGFHRRAFVGLGFGSYYDGYYPYAHNDDYYDDGGCYVVRRRVHTRYGWRVRPIQVCG